MTVRRLPSPIELLGLLLVVFGLTTRIEPVVLCPPDPLEYRERFDDAIWLDTSSSSISTVVYPIVLASQFEFIIASAGR